MAAKQGLTAQLSQAGEDARRAVLSRTGVTSSWFSNLNTVCTIKSAPPRTPEVLQMLATKSGWLYKRNEQHVWQARWCCVVPHMFLYYFDANIGVGPSRDAGKPLPQNPTAEQQEAWNRAVQKGYSGRKQHEKRSSLYLFNQGHSAKTPESGGDAPDNEIEGAAAVTPDSTKYATLQPSGIIDLECYSSVHKSRHNEMVLELAGDDQVNPDLRAFYFCAANEEDSDAWTSAFLNDRHSALVDECDAYKQVCDGFASQLQVLHAELDQAQLTASEVQDQLYRVRSQQEDQRRATWRSMEDSVMSSSSCPELEKKRIEFRASLETIRAQDLGVQAAVQMLLEYTKTVERMCEKLHDEKKNLESDLKATGQVDQEKVQLMSVELNDLKSKYEQEKKQWEKQLETATDKYLQSQKELQDVHRELSSTKMEITMFQTQQRNKIAELQQHKKILKKEVIDLRTKLENANSELGVLKHREEKLSLQTEQERQKNTLLERYVEKIESQVKVQQNVMEMMSAAGSVYGDRSVSNFDASSGGRRGVVYVRTENKSQPSENDEDDDVAPDGLGPISDLRRRRSTTDDDNRSHMSELTEDRTQRHFETFHRDFSHQQNGDASVSRARRSQLQIPSPRGVPPSLIIGVSNNNTERDQPTSTTGQAENFKSASSVPPIGLPPRADVKVRDSMSVTPTAEKKSSNTPTSAAGEKKLSVAERARLNADRGSTPVKVRVDDAIVKAVEESKQRTSQSPFNMIGSSPTNRRSPSTGGGGDSVIRRMSEALMGSSSVNGGDKDEDIFSDEGDDTTSINSTRVTDYTDTTSRRDEEESHPRDRKDRQVEEKKTSDSASTISASNLSLAERSEMQRQLQLKFLREKGLIKNPTDIRRGAGSSIMDDTSSVASSSFTRALSSTSLAKTFAKATGKHV